MNDQAILEQIAHQPSCRAVQLADRLDVELDDVQAALAGLIAVGDVTATNGKSPAGAPCQLYELSDKFKASEAYKPIFSKVVAAQFAAAHADLNKVDRAIAFIRQRGSATSAELHAVLQLPATEYVSSYLGGAMKTDRLIRDGKNWTLGPAAGQADSVIEKPVEQILTTAQTEQPPVTIPRFMSLRPQAKAEATPRATRRIPDKDQPAPAEVKPAYRCALWSDGVLEVRRDGETVAEMPQAAGESLAAFLRRLAGEGTPA